MVRCGGRRASADTMPQIGFGATSPAGVASDAIAEVTKARRDQDKFEFIVSILQFKSICGRSERGAEDRRQLPIRTCGSQSVHLLGEEPVEQPIGARAVAAELQPRQSAAN